MSDTPTPAQAAEKAIREARPVQWKFGDEFAPYHPQASHCNPDYRDGWNHCYRNAEAQLAEMRAEVERLKKDAERYRWLKAHGYYDHAEDVADIDKQIALAQCPNCLGTRAPNALDPEWLGRCECAQTAEQTDQHDEINGRPAPDAALAADGKDGAR